MINWKIEKRKVSELKIWDRNPRTITESAFNKLKERIQKRGFHDVIKIDTDDTILSGNQRKRALEELKIKEVDVKVPDRKLTDKERDEVALESNISDGTFDYDILGNEFEVDDLLDIGFSEKELNIDMGGEEKETLVECPKCGETYNPKEAKKVT